MIHQMAFSRLFTEQYALMIITSRVLRLEKRLRTACSFKSLCHPCNPFKFSVCFLDFASDILMAYSARGKGKWCSKCLNPCLYRERVFSLLLWGYLYAGPIAGETNGTIWNCGTCVGRLRKDMKDGPGKREMDETISAPREKRRIAMRLAFRVALILTYKWDHVCWRTVWVCRKKPSCVVATLLAYNSQLNSPSTTYLCIMVCSFDFDTGS